MTRKKRRMYMIGAGMTMLFAAAGLMLLAFQDNLVFFYSPSDLQEKTVEADQRFRLGGMVEEGTVDKAGQTVRFSVTDYAASTPVVFSGLLPDLFREGQGVVAEGTLGPDGVFLATEVLAKHDENYMPPEVADALAKTDPEWKKKMGQSTEGMSPAPVTN